jgi:hypothetical protein
MAGEEWDDSAILRAFHMAMATHPTRDGCSRSAPPTRSAEAKVATAFDDYQEEGAEDEDADEDDGGEVPNPRGASLHVACSISEYY